MSTNERDTHFLGFAKLLQQELSDFYARRVASMESGIIYSSESALQEIHQLIARRAYDLACHVLKTAEEHDLFADDFFGRFSLDTEAKLTEIPDLTAWPPD